MSTEVELAGIATVPAGITKSIEVARSIDASELGVVAGLLFRNFITGETVNILPVSYNELRRMTREDGHAKGLLRLLTMPVTNATWDLLSADEDNQVAAGTAKQESTAGTDGSPERDFVYNNLFKPAVEGGMSTPFANVVSSMVLAVRDGFRAFEKVFALDDRGKIILKKLAFRENDTIHLLSDDHGDFNGMRQVAYFGGKHIDVTIPKDKCVLYTFGKEESPLYGSPLFLPVYYHMDKKHKLYYIAHVAYQQLAVPPRVGTVPGAYAQNKEVKDLFMKNLATLGFHAAMTMPEGFEIEAFESKRSLADFIPLLDHHNSMASRAVLGQFMELATSSGGKLAGVQGDMFVMGIVSILHDLETVFNNWIIPQIVDFNFKSKSYPKLRARAFTDTQQQSLATVFQAIMTSGANHCSPQFLAQLEKKMAGQLDIANAIDYDTVENEMIDNANAMREALLNPPDPTGPGTPPQSRPGKKSKDPKAKPGRSTKGEGNG